MVLQALSTRTYPVKFSIPRPEFYRQNDVQAYTRISNEEQQGRKPSRAGLGEHMSAYVCTGAGLHSVFQTHAIQRNHAVVLQGELSSWVQSPEV